MLYRGHNGKVKSVAWLPDNTRLVSAGVDGAVYEWRLKDFKRSKENVLKVWVVYSAMTFMCLRYIDFRRSSLGSWGLGSTLIYRGHIGVGEFEFCLFRTLP